MNKHLQKYVLFGALAGFSFLRALGQTPPKDECGTVLSFDGSNDFVQLEKPSTFGSSSMTLEAWIKVPKIGERGLTSSTRVGNIFSNYNSSPNVNFELHNGGELRFYWNMGEVDTRGTTDLRDNKWHHVAYTRDLENDITTVYLDGNIEFTTSVGTNITFTTPHRIGADNRTTIGGVPFHGDIAMIKVWSVAKTLEEITSSITSPVTTTENNLLHYYDFNDGENSSKLTDYGSEQNHGILTNMDTIEDWVKPDGSEDPRTFASFTENSCGKYNWNGEVLTSTGVYEQIITNSTGCDSLMTLDLTINPLPLNTVSVEGSQLTSNATEVNYSWIDCDNNTLINETGKIYSVTTDGNFAVIVDNGTCVDTSDCQQIIVSGTNNFSADSHFELYPNPTNGNFKIKLDNVYPNVSVNITDITGISIKKESFELTNHIDLNFDAESGIYLVDINTGSGLNKNIRLVIK